MPAQLPQRRCGNFPFRSVAPRLQTEASRQWSTLHRVPRLGGVSLGLHGIFDPSKQPRRIRKENHMRFGREDEPISPICFQIEDPPEKRHGRRALPHEPSSRSGSQLAPMHTRVERRQGSTWLHSQTPLERQGNSIRDFPFLLSTPETTLSHQRKQLFSQLRLPIARQIAESFLSRSTAFSRIARACSTDPCFPSHKAHEWKIYVGEIEFSARNQ